MDLQPGDTTPTTNEVQNSHGNDTKQLKICALNVCGLTSKIMNGVFIDYFKQFDIFCISESKLSKGKNIPNYTVFNANKSEKYRLPGVHGLQVYIKNPFATHCSKINNIKFLCEAVLWIKISNDLILGALYVPNQNSPYYCSQFFDDMALDICSIRTKYDLPLMLVGDFNSRTGTMNDIMLNETFDDVLDISNFLYPNILDTFKRLNIPISRTNKDRPTNNNGEDLIDLCLCHELVIINGRFGDDKHIGKTTCDDKSTVDYMISTPDLLEKITNFTVDTFDPLYSDKHKPVHVTLNLAQSLHTVHTIPNDHPNIDHDSNEPQIRSEWDKSKRENYQKLFDMDKIQTLFNNLSLVTTNEVTEDTINSFSE